MASEARVTVPLKGPNGNKIGDADVTVRADGSIFVEASVYATATALQLLNTAMSGISLELKAEK